MTDAEISTKRLNIAAYIRETTRGPKEAALMLAASMIKTIEVLPPERQTEAHLDQILVETLMLALSVGALSMLTPKQASQ
jgi:hypothetical protein